MVINVSLIAFGLWCVLWPVRRGWPSSVTLAWPWIVMEVINGTGHTLWTLRQGSYTPGVATAPLVFALAVYLGLQARHVGGQSAAG